MRLIEWGSSDFHDVVFVGGMVMACFILASLFLPSLTPFPKERAIHSLVYYYNSQERIIINYDVFA